MQAVIRFLGGREGEETKILLLLSTGFSTGVFIAFMQATSESLFMSRVGSEYASEAFLVRGGLGVISTSIYVYLQRKMKFSALALFNALFVCLYVFGIRIAYDLYDPKIVSFTLFVMFGPVVSITLLSFWGIFGRVFDVRASKRVIGGIDTGQLLAIFLSFFAIIALRSYIVDDTANFLWISALGAAGTVLMTLVLVQKYNLDSVRVGGGTNKRSTEKKKHRQSHAGYMSILKDNYYLLLSLFLILSVCASSYNEFTYLTSIDTWYKGDEESITIAVSTIDALIIVVGFLVQSFVNDYIMSKFGLKISLMVMPIFLGIFTIGSIVAGHLFSYESAASGYFVFFSFNVMGRILTASLRDSLENPAFKTFFFPLDAETRYDIQSRIEGVVKEVAELIGGGTLILLGLLSFFKFIYFSYVLMFVVAACVYVAAKLFTQYKRSLQKSLLRQKRLSKERGQQQEKTVVDLLKREMSSRNDKAALLATKVMERTDPIAFRDDLLGLLKSQHASLRRYAYHKFSELNLFEKYEDLSKCAETEHHAGVKEEASKALAVLERAHRFRPSFDVLDRMSKSDDMPKRKLAAQLLRKTKGGDYSNVLQSLMRDINPGVRNEAIISVGQMRLAEFWVEVINNLHLPAYSNTAKAALVCGRRAAFQPVDLVFYRTNQKEDTMFRIVQIIGRIGGREAIERLWKKVDYPNKKILNQVVLFLNYNGYQATGVRAERMKIQIEAAIGNIVWNLNALLYIKGLRIHAVDKMLMKALEEENAEYYDEIFTTMSVIYDPQSVELVRENIDMGSSESITYAIELMNVFLDDNIKPRLFPLYDDLRPEERVTKLSDHYAIEKFKNYEDLLCQIAHRDYEKTNRWTKALALYKLASLDNTPASTHLMANIFHPDKLLLQTTAYAIYKKNKTLYRESTSRMTTGVAKWLDASILPPSAHSNTGSAHTQQRTLLLVERTILLKKTELFAEIQGDLLTELSDVCEDMHINKGQTFIKEGDSGDKPIYIILRGEVEVSHQGRELKKMSKGVVGLNNLTTSDKFRNTYTALGEVHLLVVGMEEFFNLAGKYPRMVEAMLRYARGGEKEEVRETAEVERIA